MKRLFFRYAVTVAIWMALAGALSAQTGNAQTDQNISSPVRNSSAVLDISGGYNLGSGLTLSPQKNVPGSWISDSETKLSLTPPNSSLNQSPGNLYDFKGGRGLLFDTKSVAGALDPLDTSNPSNQWPLLLAELGAKDRNQFSNGMLTINSIPEPASWALLFIGFFILGLSRYSPRRTA